MRAERKNLPALFCKLEASAAICYGESGIVVRAVSSLKGWVAAGEDRANFAEAQDPEMLDARQYVRVSSAE